MGEEVKTAQSIPDTDRYSADSVTGADTTAFPVDIDEKGDLVSKERTVVGEDVEDDPSVYQEFTKSLKTPQAKKLEKKIDKEIEEKVDKT